MTAPKPDALARLEALHAAATPGEWQVRYAPFGPQDCIVQAPHPPGRAYGVDVLSDEMYDTKEADALSIVALHNAFPAMAAVVRAAREYREQNPNAPCGIKSPCAKCALDAAFAEFEKEVVRG